MKDIQLIVAHLLGGTSGLNLSEQMSALEIKEKVTAALLIAKEIYKQTEQLEQEYIMKGKRQL